MSKRNTFWFMLRNYRIKGHNGDNRIVLKTKKGGFDRLTKRKAADIIVNSLMLLARNKDLKITIEQARDRKQGYEDENICSHNKNK